MAQKRMFSRLVISTDAFLDMPASTQLLYFHLNMEADDDGFVSSPKKIMRLLGSTDDDFKILCAKRFILPFESGICVIKHWLIHNYIRKDTYEPTKYFQEKNTLTIKENGSYTDAVDGSSTEPSRSIGKVRLDKVSLESGGFSPPTPKEIAKKFFEDEDTRRKVGVMFSQKYDVNIQAIAEEIRKFTRYWTEPNKSGSRQRWETEKTFEVSRRFETWLSRAGGFQEKKQTNAVRI